MEVLDLIWLNGFVAVVLLFFILYTLIKKNVSTDSDEKLRQQTFDILTKVKSDLENTV